MNLRCIPFQYITPVTSHRNCSSHYIIRNCIPLHFTQYIHYVSGNGGDPDTATKTELDISWSKILLIYIYIYMIYITVVDTILLLAHQSPPHCRATFSPSFASKFHWAPRLSGWANPQAPRRFGDNLGIAGIFHGGKMFDGIFHRL